MDGEFLEGLLILPEWLEEMRVSDEALASAYDSFPAKYRASLKTGLALASFHFGQTTDGMNSGMWDTHAGFWKKAAFYPAELALIMIGPSCRASALLAACCVLPILANVDEILAISVDGEPAPELLLALQLSGIEDIFSMDRARFPDLLAIAPNIDRTRICFLHNGELGDIVGKANELGFCYRECLYPPNVLVRDPERFDMKLLEFCLGFRPGKKNMKEDMPLDAIYSASPGKLTAEEMGASGAPRLTLGPGCEGFWLFPDLDPEFFKIKNFAFGFLEDSL